MTTKTRKPFAERIRAGLEESLAHARGDLLTLKTVTHLEAPPEIDPATLVALRTEASMSQAVFARLLSTSTKTVQSWEQGKRKPSPASRRLIHILAMEPEAMCRVAGLKGVKLKGFSVKSIADGRRCIVLD